MFLAKRMHSTTVLTEVLIIEAGSIVKSRVSWEKESKDEVTRCCGEDGEAK
jgi:hypothetical protein